MRRHLIVLIAVLVILGFSSAYAQSSPARLCVPELLSEDPTVSITATRDALIKFLGKQKNLPAETIAFDTAEPAQVVTQARDKKCDYVVSTVLTEVHSESGYTGGLQGQNLQNFFVTVEYKLNRVADGAALASGSLKASDRSGPQTATISTMKKISDKVAETLRNSASAPAK